MIKEVIVVEGVNDTKRLKEFFEVETIETHGLGLDEKTIDLIRKINEKRGVILFLDPDTPGEKIRHKINALIPGLKNAFVMKEDARTSKKVGIEHADKQVLQEALENLVTYGEKESTLSLEEYDELGLRGRSDSASRREKVAAYFHLGRCNGKTLYKRLNMAMISYEEIKKIL